MGWHDKERHMRFTRHNSARRASVHDVDLREAIDRVVEIDTEAGTVTVAIHPVRSSHDGIHVATEQRRYRSIYPIYGGGIYPELFHCYGRLL